ncbi:MAG TPA: DUF5666 domain-containing protein [Aggregatilineaceae bacterium]|nr:DUF5666 domain-containing protein [Aggregatilineaceae bacterium]
MKIKMRYGLLLGLLVSMVLPLSVVIAQESIQTSTPLQDKLEVVGTLDEMGTDFVVVSGLTFDTTKAEVESGLVVGDVVKVHASLADDGSWIALEVRHEDDSHSGDDLSDGMEVIGAVDALGSDTITVAGIVFDTTQAEINGTLLVGTVVKVHASLNSAGVWVAREVELHSEDESGHDMMDDSHHDGSEDDSSSDTMDDSGDDDSAHEDSHHEDSHHEDHDSGHDD